MPRWPGHTAPVYMRIAVHLRAGILTGRYTDYLPASFALPGKFGCGLSTVSLAFSVLKNDGLATMGKGRIGRVLIRTPRRLTGDGYAEVLAKGKPAIFCTRCWMPVTTRDRHRCDSTRLLCRIVGMVPL